MGISNYLKDIGRGKDGARALDRTQAADLMGQVLDGHVSDLEVGAFCIAMRVKGETPDELAGFLDALHQRLHPVHPPATSQPTIVLPSYNGARKLPVLTPLLALLLARQGLAVLMHGCETEDKRISSLKVLLSLDFIDDVAINIFNNNKVNINNKGKNDPALPSPPLTIHPGQVAFAPTGLLHLGLQKLLDVRRTIGLRNPAHSLVKLMQPVAGPALLVTSYTHPEYLHSMTATLRQTATPALLLRGTEGEAVADARRCPAMDAFAQGHVQRVQEAQTGSLAHLPDLPPPDAPATAAWMRRVLQGDVPVPAPIATQVQRIVELAHRLSASPGGLPLSPPPCFVCPQP